MTKEHHKHEEAKPSWAYSFFTFTLFIAAGSWIRLAIIDLPSVVSIINASSSWTMYLYIALVCIMYLTMIVGFFYAGYLMSIKKTNAYKFTRNLLILTIVNSILFHIAMTAQGTSGVLTSIWYPIIWLIYLAISKNVKQVLPIDKRTTGEKDNLLLAVSVLSFILYTIWVVTGPPTYLVDEVNESDYIGFNTYTDKQITMKYPSYLVPSEFSTIEMKESMHLILKMKEPTTQGFYNNLMLGFFDPEGKTLEEIDKILLSDVNSTSNASILSKNKTLFLDQPAIETVMTYSYPFDGKLTPVKVLTITSLNTETIVFFEFTATADTFDYYSKDIRKSVDSLRFFQ